jgi:hypothetical protein
LIVLNVFIMFFFSSALFCRTKIIHMTTYVSRRLNALCIKFKIITWRSVINSANCVGCLENTEITSLFH